MLDGVVNEAGVIGERADDRVIVREGELLFGFVAIDELANGAQAVTAVGVGDLTGVFELIAAVPVGQAQSPCKTRTPSTPRDCKQASAQRVQCGPIRRIRPKIQAAPRSMPLIFSLTMCFGWVLNRPGSCHT